MLPSIDLGFLEVGSTTFFWIIGILMTVPFYSYFAPKVGISRPLGILVGLLIVILEAFGAKILFFIENPSSFEDGVSWLGGFSLFGVFLFTPLFLVLVALFLKRDVLSFLDYYAPGILIELAFYRVGCTLAGCCHGIYVSWGISDGHTDGLFPVQPIEIALDLFLFAFLLLLILRKDAFSRKGLLLGTTFLGYGVIRFALEFVRERTNILGELSLSHVWAFITILAGALFLFLSLRKGKKAGKEGDKPSLENVNR